MRTSTSAFLASSQRCRLEGEHEGLSLVSACFFRLCVDRDTQISEVSNARMQLTRASHPRDQRHQALLQEGRLDAPSGSSGVHRMRHVPSIPVEVAATLVILERARVTELDAGGGGQRVSQQVATHTVNARASDAQHGAQARGAGPGILRGVTLHAHLLAERLSAGGAVGIADQHLLAVLELRHKLVPCWLHGFAVASPARRRFQRSGPGGRCGPGAGQARARRGPAREEQRVRNNACGDGRGPRAARPAPGGATREAPGPGACSPHRTHPRARRRWRRACAGRATEMGRCVLGVQGRGGRRRHQGAWNLTKTVLPADSSSKLSFVSECPDTAATATAHRSAARSTMRGMSSVGE